MPEPNRESVEKLFHQAIDLEPERRAGFLDRHCSGDPDLREAVEELLRFDAMALDNSGFLRSPAASVRAGFVAAEIVPAAFGRYRILRQHGEGGMATVYEAEQDNPRRIVALKVIRSGLATPEIVKRFRDESQILARLQHPGIAQVYDSGTTEDGHPFFAMEFITGQPLDEFAQSRKLDAPERLELLAKVCDAVQQATSS
jgi:eukaryotic-like serine/threonine-protein kinase